VRLCGDIGLVATVLVVTSSPPSVEGGHLVIGRELVNALREAGHIADLVITPQNPFGQATAYAKTWLTNVRRTADGRPVDRVISLRFPSYAVRHPSHVSWLNHRMREYYDLWDRFSASLSWKNKVKEGVRRRLIHTADGWLLRRNVRRIFAQSKTIQRRLARWGGLSSEVLYPPAPARAYRCDQYGDYLFTVSRLAPLKRQDLVLRALARPECAGIRMVLAGDGPELQSLMTLRRELGLDSRVELAGRIDDDQVLRHLSACRAVVFPPLDEDYGFVTMEAFSSGKAVVTCRDSGGPAELVRDGQNGFVTDPTPESLARAMRTLMDDRTLAIRHGEAARSDASRLTWRETVARLLE
jgi:glycosyltransferase involved in cell wall biosynthesis